MEMLYNSESYVVVRFEVPADPHDAAAPRPGAAVRSGADRGGYEIVDKFAGRQIYLSGDLADSFKSGVEALIEATPSEEAMDAFLERFTPLMQQPVVLH